MARAAASQLGIAPPLAVLLFSIGFALGWPWLAAAAITVSPAVIDEKAKARDILKHSIVLTNPSGRMVEVYPAVFNIDAAAGRQEFREPASADQAVSLANWIKLSRAAILLKPGQEQKIDFTIDVNLRAKPGAYHALVSFPEGSNRYEAEARIAAAASLTLNLEVLEDIRERFELVRFMPERRFAASFPVSFSYTFRNAGNRPLAARGEIRIYDRRGAEVAALPVNAEEVSIAPEISQTFSSAWRGSDGGSENRLLASLWSAGSGFGRYKAVLDLEYGARQGRLQDIVFFWVFPWPAVAGMFGLGAGLIVSATLWLHRRYAYAGDDHSEGGHRLDVALGGSRDAAEPQAAAPAGRPPAVERLPEPPASLPYLIDIRPPRR